MGNTTKSVVEERGIVEHLLTLRRHRQLRVRWIRSHRQRFGIGKHRESRGNSSLQWSGLASIRLGVKGSNGTLRPAQQPGKGKEEPTVQASDEGSFIISGSS